MFGEFQRLLALRFPFLNIDTAVLVAVSGGLDSVVLTDLLFRCGIPIRLAHCNFQLRGAESQADSIFVKALAERLNVPYFETTFDTEAYKKQSKGSIQMVARELRYDWFQSILKESKISYLATAHHLDDSMETFLINLGRGTGLQGLSGIPALNDYIVRPLQSFSRKDILEYAQNEKLEWHEDTSNKSDKYIRNYIRIHVIPELKKVFPNFEKVFSKTTRHLSQAQQVLQQHLTQTRDSLFEHEGAKILIPIDRLEALNPLQYYIRELFSPFGFTQFGDIEALVHAQSGKQILSPTHRLEKDRSRLILQAIQEKTNVYEVSENQRELQIPDLKISIREAIFDKDNFSKSVLYLDKSKLKFPLVFRKWKLGDRFFPSGMKGQSKKLSKYFKDEKYALADKESQWLLCNGDDIVWVVGRRPDERYRMDAPQPALMISVDFLS